MNLPLRAATGVLAAALALSVGTAMGGAPVVTGEVHVDLKSESGARVASLTGSIGPAGTGWGNIAPLSGAPSIGLKRAEPVRFTAHSNSTITVGGQRGTLLTLTDRTQGRRISGFGKIAVAEKGGLTVHVNATGGWEPRPFHPRKGQTILVVGKARGVIRDALARRYTLVAYSPSVHSRDALMAAPDRYANVAGLLIGADVGKSRLEALDLARAFHNEGRLVATTGRNGVLDRHLYHLTHAHLGERGAITYRDAPPLGSRVHAYRQIREPIIVHAKTGAARAKDEKDLFTPEMRARAVKAAQAHLVKALAGAERIRSSSAAVRPKGRNEMQNSDGPAPAQVTAPTGANPAYYQVAIDQNFQVQISAPSILPALTYVPVAAPAPVATGVTISDCSSTDDTSPACPWIASPSVYDHNNCGFLTAIWMIPVEMYCVPIVSGAALPAGVSGDAYQPFSTQQCSPVIFMPPTCSSTETFKLASAAQTVLSQQAGITYNSIYTVSLTSLSNQAQERQAVTETSSVTFDAALPGPDGSMPLGAGTYGTTNNLVSPVNPFTSGFRAGWREAAWGLAMQHHQIAMACPSCTDSGNPGAPATVVMNQQKSAPTQTVSQVSVNGSTGVSTSTGTSNTTSWDQSNTHSSSWNVSGSVGFFGPVPTINVGGGYGQSDSSTTSNGGSSTSSSGTGTSMSTSVGATESNWTTTPVQGTNSAQYTTYSTAVSGASGASASAASGIPYPSAPPFTSNTGGFIQPEAGYGGPGPGPTCTAGPQCGATQLNPQPWGGGENIIGFQQGSVSFFNVNTPSTQLAVGSVNPQVMDTFYLYDQADSCQQFVGVSDAQLAACLSDGTGATPVGQYIELQVLGASTVKIAQSPGASGASDVASAGGAGIGTGITTYYDASGNVARSGASNSVWKTTGLDLCAPPVLTPALWTAGCDADPNFSGPPASYSGAPPTVTTNSTSNPIQTGASGQPFVQAPAPALICSPGKWSGSPTFTYQWQVWNASYGIWKNIQGATSTTFTPPATAPAGSPSTGPVYTCNVTASNGIGKPGSAQAHSVAVLQANG